MKYVFIIVLTTLGCLITTFRTAAQNYSGQCTWTLSGNTLTISPTAAGGKMADYSLSGAPWYGSRGSITTLVIEEGVT